MNAEIAEDRINQLLIDDKIRGKSYAQIAAKHGLDVDEVMRRLRQVYTETTIRDPVEHRALLQLRIEKIVELMWTGLEQGSFKHGEAILKAVAQLQELHDLNEKTITHEVRLIIDEDADRVLEVLKFAQNALLDRVMRMPLTPEIREELVQWPEWSAEASTDAVEAVLYNQNQIEEED